MTEQHPITPSPELVEQLCEDALLKSDDQLDYVLRLIYAAYRAGADQELEACVKWIEDCGYHPSVPEDLRVARRPKPPSPKKEALQVLEVLIESRRIVDPEYQALRHALEQLND